MNRRAKIVATIGPASQDEETLTSLINAGMNVARLNFSHGTQDHHAQIYKRLRELSLRLNKPLTILQDLPGPKLRIGKVINGQIELSTNQKLILTSSPVTGNAQRISVDLPQFSHLASPGKRILLDDGHLELEVESVEGDQVVTKVVLGGILKSHKGLNLPGTVLDIEGFTSKDKADLAFGLKLGVDMVAISFVRRASDIEIVRSAIHQLSPGQQSLPIIGKLERPEALTNLDEIVKAADGVMVARGDLGVEMSPEEVPTAQKRIIETANQNAKIVITATQMLDSMIQNPRPTRAEASDVANAILDGTDAVMLSGETAIGKYPVQTVQTMHAIICQAEKYMYEWGRWQGNLQPIQEFDDTFYMAQAARALAHDRNVAAIAVFTKSGRTASLVAKNRPEVPILAFTSSGETYQQMNILWGITPYLVPYVDTIEGMLSEVESVMLTANTLQPGQQIVLICGFPINAGRPTNLALLHTVGEIKNK